MGDLPPPSPTFSLSSWHRTHRWRLWLILLVVAFHGWFMAAPDRLEFFGFSGGGGGKYPLFIDSIALLAAGETNHLGGDPFQAMALDPYHRKHSYSSWWFALGDWGLTPADNVWFGPLFVLMFAGAALAWMPMRGAGEFWWQLGTACSSPILLATTRANNDLVVFALLAPLAPCLLSSSRMVRLVAPFLIALAAGLKYYPLVAVLLLLAEPEVRDRRFRLGVMALLLLMVAISVGGDLKYIQSTQPTVVGTLGFGAPNGLEILRVPVEWRGRVGVLCGLGLGLGAFFTRNWSAWLRRMAREVQWLQFILGAALLAGCFWTGLSWEYRWVFALWLVPFLWRPVEVETMPAAARRWWLAARGSYWMALWGGCGYYLIYDHLQAAGHAPPYWFNLSIWAVVQAGCWILCAALTVLVGAFAWEGLRGLRPAPREAAALPQPL